MMYVFILIVIILVVSALETTSKSTPKYEAALAAAVESGKSKKAYCVEISPEEIASSLEMWHDDLAIVFYAPWCQYCKQMLIAWEAIATTLEPHSRTVFGKFNCEESEAHTEICQYIGIYQYPSILFIGFGDFHQASPPSAPVPVRKFPNVVRFTSDLYFEAIYDWLKLLSFMSRKKRKWDEFKGFFTGKSYLHKRYFNSFLHATVASNS
jgi:thiol-disulfide isomerase/thioredoxin